MKLNLITALTKNYGIGKNGGLPWKIKEEMELFKILTTGILNNYGKGNNAVLMGKNTWFSIPPKYRPLENRANIVISSKFQQATMMYKNPDEFLFYGFNDIDKALNVTHKLGINDLYIIGGSKIYEYCLKNYFIDKIVISIIENDYECDTFFPKEVFEDYLEYFNLYNCHSKNKMNIDYLINYMDSQLEESQLEDSQLEETDNQNHSNFKNIENIVHNSKFTTYIHHFNHSRFKLPFNYLNYNTLKNIEYSINDTYADKKRKELLQQKLLVKFYINEKLYNSKL